MSLILAVDDHLEMLRSIGSVLEAEHSCILASRASEALGCYLKNHPALVLLDLVMPEVRGEVLARRILERDPAARIVIFSVIENVRKVVDLFRMGVRDYLVKPCEGTRLLDVVNANLSETRPEDGVVTETTASVRKAIVHAFEKSRIPLLVGPRGIGKRTEMKAVLGAMGVDSPPVLDLVGSADPLFRIRECVRTGPRKPGGLVVRADPASWSPNTVDALERALLGDSALPWPAGEGFLGFTWDMTCEIRPAPRFSGARFEAIRFPSLAERKGELLSILGQFRHRGGTEDAGLEDDLPWIEAMVENHPRFGTMRLMKALANGAELRRHLRDRRWS
ncbi:MAG: response regulator [Planctomycetota bacterium]|jgi:FixJ family two-component response regulator